MTGAPGGMKLDQAGIPAGAFGFCTPPPCLLSCASAQTSCTVAARQYEQLTFFCSPCLAGCLGAAVGYGKITMRSLNVSDRYGSEWDGIYLPG